MKLYALTDGSAVVACDDHARFFLNGARESARPVDDPASECAFCRSARLSRPPEKPLVLGRPNYMD
jgi:hypothetical protein